MMERVDGRPGIACKVQRHYEQCILSKYKDAKGYEKFHEATETMWTLIVGELIDGMLTSRLNPKAAQKKGAR